MQILRKILVAVPLGILVYKLEYAADAQAWDEALRILDKLERLAELPAYQLLTKCQALWGVGKYAEAARLASSADQSIQDDPFFSPHRKKYLRAYANELINAALEIDQVNSALDFTPTTIDYYDLDLSRVPSRDKKGFPLKGMSPKLKG